MIIKKQPDYIIKEWNKEIKAMMYKRSGIYVLYIGQRCLYVGASQSLETRVIRFFDVGCDFTNFILGIVVKYCKENKVEMVIKVYFHEIDSLRELEVEYIKYFNPRLNCQKKPSYKNKTWRDK